jgi:YHS domain-containing protein
LSGSHSDRMAAAPAKEFIDPVCGMKVSPDTAAGKVQHTGETYYFCSTGCVDKFKHDPKKYLQTRRLEDLPQDAEYTCPMHRTSSRSDRGRVRSAAWPWNRRSSRLMIFRTQSIWT